ncbi:OmpA family protein [Rhodoferax sp.]|uniref:OmpA family protein n=1 Tax=Rhodoferax sp. TaxID=50421 RepID=UPI0025EF15C7|nr:OmpA family protein [Rhodoferax sp.]
MSRRLVVLGLSVALQACTPISRVTLLPDSEGRNTAVQVTGSAGVADLVRPYQTAAQQRDGRLQTEQSSAEAVQAAHGQLLALPLPVATRLALQFEPGTSRLTAESEAQLPQILEQAKARSGGEIQVVGHTDRTGSPAANDALSLQRAQAVRALLIERGFSPDLVVAIGRGEREPVVPTEANVNEPRNRRAEIIIR